MFSIGFFVAFSAFVTIRGFTPFKVLGGGYDALAILERPHRSYDFTSPSLVDGSVNIPFIGIKNFGIGDF